MRESCGLDRTPAPPFDALMLPQSSYHYYDVSLFHAALSANAARRVQALAPISIAPIRLRRAH